MPVSVPRMASMYDLLLEPALHIAAAQAMLCTLERMFKTRRRTALDNLGVDLNLKLKRHVCKARSMLFCCSPTEVAQLRSSRSARAKTSRAQALASTIDAFGSPKRERASAGCAH